jgi:hypothetical protein
MVKNTGRHYKKHILTGVFFFGDCLLLWNSIVRESALRCLCPTSCVELRGECGWLPVSEWVQVICMVTYTVMGQDSVVGIATCCGLGHLGIESHWKQDMLHLP